MSYRELKSYQQATTIYDFTVKFCDRYIDRKSRTVDQMVQAARSGKQNIVEGASEKTSKQGALKLTGVARASFQELLEDYEDFLRQRELRLWDGQSAEAQAVRALVYETSPSYKTYMSYIDNPEVAANAMICLINQTDFLLDRQIKFMEKDFAETGGYMENLKRKRENAKKEILFKRFIE